MTDRQRYGNYASVRDALSPRRAYVSQLRRSSIALALVLMALPAQAQTDSTSDESAWTAMRTGIETRELRGGTVRAFRLDLNKVKLTASQRKNGGVISDFTTGSDTLLAINGNFFDPQYRTQGLLLVDGKRLSRLKRADWGVFSVRKRKGAIVHTRQWEPKSEGKLEFAVQCGPRLVVDGRVLKLKAQWARRTAIGVEKNSRYVHLVVVNESVSTSELAQMMKRLGARYAMNLDGGSSTQLWLPGSSEKLPQGVPVANAILVQAR